MEVVREESRYGKWRRWWRIWATGGVDHEAVLQQIAEDSGWTGRYAFLIVISAAISLLGLLMPSVAVLIGAMLLSPLMMPIIGLGFGIATLDFHEIRRSAVALAAGSAVAFLLSILLVSISPVQTITSEIAARTQPTLFDLLVALLSAIAGAYALIRGRGSTVVGVAIAIALMPPLVVVGFGPATWNWTVFSGSLLLFLTNLVTIALTAALVARVYGFGSYLSPHHTGWQLALFVVGLGILAIPLSAALRHIAFETVAQRQIREAVRARFPSDARLSQMEIDFARSPMRVRAVMLTPRTIGGPDQVLAADLRKLFGQPVDVHVDQLRISPDAAAAEAAQIAQANDAQTRQNDERNHAISTLALIAGTSENSVGVDLEGRTLRTNASALPGLGLEGYHVLEERAARVLPNWTVRLAPPGDISIPQIGFDQGVANVKDLDLVAWASDRLAGPIVAEGGTAALRNAIVEGLIARGGQAEVGPATGRIRIARKERTDAPSENP